MKEARAITARIHVTSPVRGRIGKVYRTVLMDEIIYQLNRPAAMRRMGKKVVAGTRGAFKGRLHVGE